MFTGTILNAAGIVAGGVLGLTLPRQLSAPTQLALRGLLGVATVWLGLRLTWGSLNGTLLQMFKQFLVLLLALMLGRLTGRLLGVQAALSRLGKVANERFAAARAGDPNLFSEGFWICSILFCAGPLGPLGSIVEGLGGGCWPLAIKTIMDCLAVMGLTRMFGWGALLSAVPVGALQFTITAGVVRLQPVLDSHGLVDATNAAVGMLIFCVALMLLEIKHLRLGDYLPSILLAPLLTWLW